MKTKITICSILISIFAVAMFFSCDIPMALGTKLDIEGPVVEISTPSNRKTVPRNFDLAGTVRDDTGIDRMLITAKINNKAFPRQWRYQNGAWQVSDNYGASWSSFSDGVWNGTINSAAWKIKVDMEGVSGYTVIEGEYTFTVQAWDKADFTDDNSIKAVIVILDLNPPKADISYPFLVRGAKPYETDPDFTKLHLIPDTGTYSKTPKEYEDPAYLGKFYTQEFELKWQVEDMNDVYSIDLRFYKFDVDIDGDPVTALPDDYIYKFTKKTDAPLSNVRPGDYIKPNGSVIIPDLAGATGTFDQGGQLQTNLTEKTTIKVVAVCLDAAGLPNQEKILGYFIFWPRANNPWITFTDGMNPYKPSEGASIASIENNTFTVYPSKTIKLTAYQAYGVKKVEYSIHKCIITGGTLTGYETEPYSFDGIIYKDSLPNDEYSTGMYSKIFAPTKGIGVPPLTDYYVLKAKAFSNKDKPSVEYEMLFRIYDIKFPGFPTQIQPASSDPLYLAKNDAGNYIMNSAGTQFTITGTVDDATDIKSLCLVWINPESRDSAVNAQLAYFQDKDYVGWKDALTLTASGAANAPSASDGTFDSNYPNKLWKLNPVYQKVDPATNRRIYTFSKVINLSDLNIRSGSNPQPLRSQMFLLRAENPVDRCTIITYAPQGDTSAPAIKIDKVDINQGGTITTCYPNQYTVIEQFATGNTINITGKWREDSVKNLNLTTFFKNYFEININNTLMNLSLLNLNTTAVSDTDGSWDGTWTLSATVGSGAGQVPLKNLSDTLVIDVKTQDIGGNVAQIQNSWLIKSDRLQLMRISSDKPDDTYGNTEQIEIFLEFSKPVKLNSNFTGTKTDIQLILSSATGNTARAKYKDKQDDQNSRQYFVYTVGPGEDTINPEYLNVKGLYFSGTVGGTVYPGEFTTGTAYNQASYPFAWSRGTGGTDFEEVRLTMSSGQNGEIKPTGANYYVRTLPTNTTSGNSDYQYTLYAAKHIKIDTAVPKITGISTTTPAGYYNAGDIYFTVTFNEPVKLGDKTGDTVPRFYLGLTSGFVSTSENPADVRVSGNTVTFKHTIVNGQTSNGNQLYVARISEMPTGYNDMLGSIRDIAGNALPSNALTLANLSSRTLNGVYIETQKPGNPTVRVIPSKNIFTRTNTTNNTYTSNNHGLANNDEIYVNGSATKYYVRTTNTTPNTIQIVTTSGGTNYQNLGDTIFIFTTTRGFSQNVNGVANYGTSLNEDRRDLSNVYNQELWLAIEGNKGGDNATTPYKCDDIEYSIDNGANWLKPDNKNNTPFKLERTGEYKVKARQTDKAGNKSDESALVTFTWDPGALLTRISSTSANGEYTHVKDGYKQILITLNFRKPLYFTATPEITLNVRNNKTTPNPYKTVQTARPTSPVSSLTFTYNVIDGDYTPTSPAANLDITGFDSGGPVWDGSGSGVGVNITLAGDLLNLPSGTPKLDSTKLFTVVTGPLEFTATPAFIADSAAGAGYNNESNSNFHGIRSDDGSYWTTLQMTFNHNISKGDGNITIKQILGDSATNSYRLPTVLTEAQYNRLRNVSVEVSGVTVNTDTYYVKGTNGYINGTGSDTSNKYILQYKYDPRRDITANNTPFNGNTYVPQAFIDTFRDAEMININVNAQAVTISEDKKTLNIRLSGSSAPQVPGATYELKLPASMVEDSLGNKFSEYTTNISLRGVAKPFVRIKKTQDTIEVTDKTSSLSQPRLVAIPPFLAYARMDCRTPGSTITYRATTGQTSVTGNSPGTSGTNNNWNYLTGPTDNATPNATRPDPPAGGTSYTISNQLTFGYVKNANGTDSTTEPTINNVQGFQWWVRARATTTAAANNTSLETEEMAYRTVISYSVRNANGAITGTAADGRSIFQAYDQAWIRGGDAIGSSSIPGFPFTWEDNWDNLAGKRAGIRLMALVDVNNTTQGMNNSLWRFVTWDLNTTAYIDFIRGRDLAVTEDGFTYTASTANEAWQYGPKRWCYQADGWTSFKEMYPIYAGKHRWCDTGYMFNPPHQAINFSGTFMARPDKTNSPAAANWPELNKP